MATVQPPDANLPNPGDTDTSDEMEFVKLSKRRRREDTEMDITPMIDVTFLLLIFFIVASKMDPQKTFDLPIAKHGLPVVSKNAVTLIITRGDGKDVKVYAGDSKDPKNLLQGDLVDQEAQIEKYVADALQDPTMVHVLVKAEKGINYRHVDRVVRAASGAIEEQSLHVAVMEEQ